MKDVSKYSGPDFFLIGMPKTGTSWVHWNLAQHPDVFLPPVKEIKYFFEKAYLPSKNRISIFFGGRHYKNWPQYLKTRPHIYASMIYRRQFNELIHHRLPWDIRFLFGRHTDRWYTNLFPKREGQIAGEISPMYATLPDEWVAYIKKLYPNLKVILIFRHPVNRIWSHTKMKLGIQQAKRLDQVPKDEFYRYFQDAIYRKTSQLQAYTIWARYFSNEQIYIDFYDRLVEDPSTFLKEFCQFLGIDYSKSPLDEGQYFHRRIGAWMPGDIPDEYKHYIAEHVYDEIEKLSSMFGGHATKWLKNLPNKTR